MKYVILVSRLLLGLMFLVFGANNVLHFLPMGLPPGDAGIFEGILVSSHWMAFVGVIMIIAGLLLLVGRFVPLALTLLGPVIVNILLYHALLFPHGYIPGVLAAVLELLLLIVYHRSFTPLFAPDPKADTSKL
jgi:uncharacterized membrane protein YphA (DoxX/SURF4 family)